MGEKRRWAIKKGCAYIGDVAGMAGQHAGTGVTNGPEEPVQMMKDVRNIEYVQTAMELWGSVRHTKE